MGGSLAGVWRRHGGIGIVPSLLMASLLAVVATVVIVQSSTLHSIILSEEHAAQERLDVNLGMLKHELLGRGSDWRLGADGRLMVDGKVAEGLDQVVEDVARITHSVATVFAGDTRMATTVKRADGSPAVGTKLAAGPARAAVIDSKMSYRGTADILGVQYFTVYEPLLDRDGHAVGILFDGVPSAKVQAVLNSIIWQTSEVALVVLLIAAVSIWLMLRATLRPLLALAGVVHTISDGHLDVSVPCADRTDQLGEIGRAVEILRVKAQHARDLGMQAARDREAQDRRQAAIDLVTQDFGGSLSGVLVGLVAFGQRHARFGWRCRGGRPTDAERHGVHDIGSRDVVTKSVQGGRGRRGVDGQCRRNLPSGRPGRHGGARGGGAGAGGGCNGA